MNLILRLHLCLLHSCKNYEHDDIRSHSQIRNVVIIISLGYIQKKANYNYILRALAPPFLKDFFRL